MTVFEERTTDHITGETQEEVICETTSDRIEKLPNGDKRVNLQVHSETPYGLSLFREALTHNPYFGSDYHIEDEKQCDSYLAILNKVIKKSDHFIILGDMDGRDSQSLAIVRRFAKGLPTRNIYLILGNNDSHTVKEYKDMGFLAVQTMVEWKNYVFSHFPVEVPSGYINIHGHLHGAADQRGLEAYDYVDGTKCVDVWTDDHKPMRLTDILKKYKTNHPEFIEESEEYLPVSDEIEPVYEAVEEKFYRITYEGDGIYEALKKRVNAREWKKILESDAINWLPKPPNYMDGYKSWFTEKGYKMYCDKTFPVFKKYLDKRLMITEHSTALSPIIYRDEYQVVVKDSIMVNEDAILRSILKFNYETNEFNYWVKNKNGVYTNDKLIDEVFANKYYVLTPEEFWKYKGGVCWDYVPYQADYFKKNYPSIKYKAFFHASLHVDPDDVPTHTFMVFQHSNFWYWIESSWKTHMGVWRFPNLPSALTFITNALNASAMQEKGISPHKGEFLAEYDPLDKETFGMNCTSYMEYMSQRPEYKYTKKKKLAYPKRYFDINQYKRIMGKYPVMESTEDKQGKIFWHRFFNEPIMESGIEYLYQSDSCSIYYEAATNDCVLLVESTVASVEEKRRIGKVLKDANYDPKTKTVEMNGQKARLTLLKNNGGAAYSTNMALTKKDERFLSKYGDIKKPKELEKAMREKGVDEATIKRYMGKYEYMKKTSSYTGDYSNPSRVGKKNKGVTLGKDKVNKMTLAHEVHHIKDDADRKRAAAEPSFVAKYGTSVLSKDARKALLILNKLKKKDSLTEEEKTKVKKLTEFVKKEIRSTDAFNKDERQKKKDALEELDKDMEKTIRNAKGLSAHNRSAAEVRADSVNVRTDEDAAAWEAQLNKNLDVKARAMQRRLQKQKGITKKSDSAIGQAANKFEDMIDLTKAKNMIRKNNHERVRVSRELTKKHGYAMERVQEILRGDS